MYRVRGGAFIRKKKKNTSFPTNLSNENQNFSIITANQNTGEKD